MSMTKNRHVEEFDCVACVSRHLRPSLPDREEVESDVAARLWRAQEAGKLHGLEDVDAYVRRVVRNAEADLYRGRSRRPEVSLGDDDPPERDDERPISFLLAGEGAAAQMGLVNATLEGLGEDSEPRRVVRHALDRKINMFSRAGRKRLAAELDMTFLAAKKNVNRFVRLVKQSLIRRQDEALAAYWICPGPLAWARLVGHGLMREDLAYQLPAIYHNGLVVPSLRRGAAVGPDLLRPFASSARQAAEAARGSRCPHVLGVAAWNLASLTLYQSLGQSLDVPAVASAYLRAGGHLIEAGRTDELTCLLIGRVATCASLGLPSLASVLAGSGAALLRGCGEGAAALAVERLPGLGPAPFLRSWFENLALVNGWRADRDLPGPSLICHPSARWYAAKVLSA